MASTSSVKSITSNFNYKWYAIGIWRILLAAAVAHDEQYKPKTVKQQVFYHDIQDEEGFAIED
jgi:hypothetical protein